MVTRAHRIGAVFAALGLSALGTQAIAGPAAGAGVAKPAARVQPSSAPALLKHAMRPTRADVAAAMRSQVSTMKPAAVSPISNFKPACYGDARPIAPVGGTLDPNSFGAFFDCNAHEWTFEVQTADRWAKDSFGDFAVSIDTDGNFSDNCSGSEFGAIVGQTATAGKFVAAVGRLAATASGCSFTQTATGIATITGTEVAVSFPWSGIGNAPSLAWNAVLQNRTEEQNNSTNGDVVPNPLSIDGPLQGGILDSVQGPSPTKAQCSLAAFNGGVEGQSATTSDSGRAASALRKAGFRNVHDYGHGIIAFSGDSSTARSVLSAAGVSAQISPSVPFKPMATFTGPPNDMNFSSQWNLPVENAAGAWAVTTGSNVVVADVDTGVDFTNNDLQSPQLVPGIDETGPSPTVINYGSGNTDTDGHGTAVAGAIAAATNNSNQLASLGFNTRVLPVKVDFTNMQVNSQIAAGINAVASNVATNHVKILNLSLGGPCPDAGIQSAIGNARNAGILVVAAAGNEALSQGFDPTPVDLAFNDAPSFPAAYPGVIAVGATGRDGFRAAYSDTGSYVTMVAPGGSGDGSASDDIPVLATGSSTPVAEAGTSFSSPQVAAAAALIWSVTPNLQARQVSELLSGTATDTGVTGPDTEYGNGMLNAGVAVGDTPLPISAIYGTFTSVPPTRILDTRIGVGAAQAKVGQGGEIDVKVAGAGPVPASGVAAVVLNTTVTNTTAPGFVTVWPTGQTRPTSSSLNFSAKQTVPNLVTVKVGAGGDVSFFNSAGTVDMLADVAGYYVDGTAASAQSRFVAVAPTRILDTRKTGGPIAGGTSRNLTVIGHASVPADAAAVVANVTVTGPTASGFLTVYPAGTTRPTASNLNFVTGETVPNEVIVKLGTGGANTGVISIFNSVGKAQVIVDVQGYFTAAGSGTGSRFFPLVNHRILDTRGPNAGGIFGPIGGGQTITVHVVGQGGVVDGASAVVMNTTATGPTSTSFLTVFPAGTARPTASDLNFTRNVTVANLVTVELPTSGGSTGLVDIFNAAGAVFAIGDVAGYFGAPGL